jgi:hypothetical protein
LLKRLIEYTLLENIEEAIIIGQSKDTGNTRWQKTNQKTTGDAPDTTTHAQNTNNTSKA